MNRRVFLGGAASVAAMTIMTGFNGKAAAQMVPRANDGAIQNYEMRNAASTIPQGFIHPRLASSNPQEVGARIVVSFDSSSSIDYSEHRMQLEVLADAIESDDIYDAIFSPGGTESVAICVTDFGSGSELRIPWLDIRKGEGYKLKLLGGEIRALLRRESGMTSHVLALKKAEECLANCPWEGRRSLVDIITDGTNNHGGGIAELHDIVDNLARHHNATVNAFITMTTSNLEEWSWKNLVTQDKYNSETLDPGFVKVVATQVSTKTPGAIVEYKDSMKLAFRRQLILETAQLQTQPVTKFAGMRRLIQNALT